MATETRKEFAGFLTLALEVAKHGPGDGYNRRVITVQVEDQCDAGAIYPMEESFEITPDEAKELIDWLQLEW